MKLRNLGFATIILILVSLSFSSCESDSRYLWADAQLKSVVTLKSDRNGYFDAYYDIDIDRDVYDLRGRPFYNVSDIRYYGGNLEIYADEDYNRGTIRLMNGDRIISECVLGGGYGGNVKNEYNDRSIQDFQADVVEYIRRYGYADILFLAESRYVGSSYIDVDIYMDIQAYVRD